MSSLKRHRSAPRRSANPQFSLTPKRLNFEVAETNESSTSSSEGSPEKSKEPRPGYSPLGTPPGRFRQLKRRALPLLLITSPSTAPRPILHSKTLACRRKSAPVRAIPGQDEKPTLQGSDGGLDARKRTTRKSRLANINPFTPAPLSISSSIKREKINKENEFRKRQCQDEVMAVGEYTPKTGARVPSPTSAHLNRCSDISTFRAMSEEEASLNEVISPFNEQLPVENEDILVDMESPLNPSKRLKVRDINISRYQDEFLELKEIVGGHYGKVKVARHRLDGMVYAIKVTKSELNGGAKERAIMNEVFAHAALMKHKNIVRYYNSWAENGRIYIQNEYCEGGSLAHLIKKHKEVGKPFSEQELKKIVSQIARGLQYIHSKHLVHMDIKPENIFLALEHLPRNSNSRKSEESSHKQEDNDPEEEMTPLESLEEMDVFSSSSEEVDNKKDGKNLLEQDNNLITSVNPSRLIEVAPEQKKIEADREGVCPSAKPKVSDDSGHASCDSHKCSSNCKEIISYKIGDLGHVAQVHGDNIPEEGDCRYFAPELLGHHLDQDKILKADVFSLGLTLYECATLEELPKNSEDSTLYERLRNGNVPYLPGYSKDFNQLIKLMTLPDPMARPSITRILNHSFVKKLNKHTHTKSTLELYRELKVAKKRIKELQNSIPLSSRSLDQQKFA